MPGLDGPVVASLYASGEAWLTGKPLNTAWVKLGL